MKLDRRLNILIYLNRNWESSYGGSLELWGKNMKKCEKTIIPTFNKTVIFSTTVETLIMEILKKLIIQIKSQENPLQCINILMDVQIMKKY